MRQEQPLPAAPVGLDESARRTLWRCRRGMKELDVLLERYARGTLAGASLAERDLLDELLELADPVLAGYFLAGVEPPDPPVAALVARIRAYVA
jgi:antitoxin CptB